MYLRLESIACAGERGQSCERFLGCPTRNRNARICVSRVGWFVNSPWWCLMWKGVPSHLLSPHAAACRSCWKYFMFWHPQRRHCRSWRHTGSPIPNLPGCAQIFPDAILHREEADYQAKLRAQKLEESQKAYKAGHRANAHELSVEVGPYRRGPTTTTAVAAIAAAVNVGKRHINFSHVFIFCCC